jgi:hypothetical protein
MRSVDGEEAARDPDDVDELAAEFLLSSVPEAVPPPIGRREGQVREMLASGAKPGQPHPSPLGR